jgi:2',5'-phosphodiesterase
MWDKTDLGNYFFLAKIHQGHYFFPTLYSFTVKICSYFQSQTIGFRVHLLYLFISTVLPQFRMPSIRRSSGRRSGTVSASSNEMAELARVKVASYNVLSTHLAAPDFYRKYQPSILEANYRLKKLQEKLDNEIKENSIICLQEVSTQCAGVLHPYFAKNNYYFIASHYGHKYNNYMGVGIAVPLLKYKVEDVDISRIADSKFTVRPPPESMLTKLFKSFILHPFLKLLQLLKMCTPPFDPYEEALRRTNQMVSVRVRQRQFDSSEGGRKSNSDGAYSSESFVVSTYHMPCMFWEPSLMMIHSALSAQVN